MKNDSLSAVIVAEAKPRHYTDPVGIVSDRQLNAAALAAVLAGGDGWILVQRARGGAAVGKLMRGFRPAVVVADGAWQELPAEIKLGSSKVLRLVDPNAGIEVLSRMMQSDAEGYLSHSASTRELRRSLKVLRATGRFIDPALHDCIASAIAGSLSNGDALLLTDRERRILADIARGKSSKQIAREFSVTAKTVCNHVSNIYRKLGLDHRGQLVQYAIEHGLASV